MQPTVELNLDPEGGGRQSREFHNPSHPILWVLHSHSRNGESDFRLRLALGILVSFPWIGLLRVPSRVLQLGNDRAYGEPCGHK